MKGINKTGILFTLVIAVTFSAYGQNAPENIRFVRQGAQRLIFDENNSIPLAILEPGNIIGLSAMHPVTNYLDNHSATLISDDKLVIRSERETMTGIWLGGFNPFSTYSIELESISGEGNIGFEFSNPEKTERFIITAGFNDGLLTGVNLKVIVNSEVVADEPVAVNFRDNEVFAGKIILQMLGSGLVMYMQEKGLPKVIGQSNFNKFLDLRQKKCIAGFHTDIFLHLKYGQVSVRKAKSALTTGVGLADIRAITYENGDPLLDNGRLWYTMSVRGRALPHHIQGVFSMDPSVFDIRFEGVIVFDRNDGLLRNEIASHIFYDRKDDIWRGLTTGFSAFANPESEKKELLAVESKTDPRFGFSIMSAVPFGMVGDIEDPHLLFDPDVNKWRMLTCENIDGYKAILLESDHWNKGFKRIAGPVEHNSTGTSIQRIGGRLFCFSGSSERNIYIYTYPDLRNAGTLKMDLPPWDETSGTRVWPNVVELPEGYPFRYVALMMDRFNYPGLAGPNWSYGAIYLYHGYD